MRETTGSKVAWLPEIRHRVEGGRLILASAARPVFSFIALLIFALVWNGLVSVFVFAFGSMGSGGPAMSLFMIPFVLVGLFLIGIAVRQFLAIFNPRIELSVNCVQACPGDVLQISWQIEGAADRLKNLRIVLAAEEVAVYRRGTDNVTDRHQFLRLPVYESGAMGPMGAAHVQIPKDAMHSFKARSNAIEWKLEVRGEIPRWPDIKADYGILVVPPGVPRG